MTREEQEAKVKGWQTFAKAWQEGPVLVNALKRVYKSWKDVELYVGGLLERPPTTPTGRRMRVLGDTHATIIASTFARLKRSDRFYYENGRDKGSRFNPFELQQIRRFSIAHLMCYNMRAIPNTRLCKCFFTPRFYFVRLRQKSAPKNISLMTKLS